MPSKNTFDDWVADIDPKLRPLAQGLRRMFLEAAPDFRESIKWGKPCFEKKVRTFYIASQSTSTLPWGCGKGPYSRTRRG